MLKNTFHHIPGVGMKSEKKLWDTGVMGWDDINLPVVKGFSKKRREMLEMHVAASLNHMKRREFDFFEAKLPASLHWRFFPEVRPKAVYLDIETTGMESYDEITTIALYDGNEIQYFINGIDLHFFPAALERYDTVITYNGKCFDIPFIENFFHIKVPHVHLDLRYILKRLGYGGGLKACEKKMGINRGDLDGVDGFFAVHLWNDYRRNDNLAALETLLAYNIEDVVNLETLMVKAYNMNIQETPFKASHTIPLPVLPEFPFTPDLATVKRIRKQFVF